MINKHFKSLLTTGCVMAAVVGSAQAGGWARGTADTDILFEQGNFNLRAGVTIVSPERTITSGPNNVGVDYADTYAVPSAAVKFKFHENVSCAGTAVQAYGGDSTFTQARVGAIPGVGKLNEDFYIMEYGATCGVNFQAGSGKLWFIGGVFTEQFDFDLTLGLLANNAPVATVALKDSSSFGWRAGVAYEIPEIALRAQLLYRSATSVSATGTGTGALAGVAGGAGELPQTVELKVQSGIAPGWLAYGSVKWTDWSVNKTLNLTINGAPRPPNQYFWRDGWTVTGGIGHAFNEQVSGTAFITWDRGVSTGYDLYADVYTFGVGAALKDSVGGELRLGGAVSYLGSVAETQYAMGSNYAVGSDWSIAGSASYVVRW